MSSDKQFDELMKTAVGALEALRLYVLGRSDGSKNGLLTLREVAALTRKTERTLRNGQKTGRFPFLFREGGRLVTTRAAYDQWLKMCEKRGRWTVEAHWMEDNR